MATGRREELDLERVAARQRAQGLDGEARGQSHLRHRREGNPVLQKSNLERRYEELWDCGSRAVERESAVPSVIQHSDAKAGTAAL